MDLLNQNEISIIVNLSKSAQNYKILDWSLTDYTEELIGYLGDHLKLTVEVEENGTKQMLHYFVKCMPRFDEWKAQYLKNVPFFSKEYRMLSSLFVHFNRGEGSKSWCPKLVYVKENLFVFEDMAVFGYEMANPDYFTYDEITATIETVARFHAQSYIYEENMSKKLGRPYRIWEDHSEYLQEPVLGADWRDTGRNAIIDYLKVYSKYKDLPNFANNVDEVITKLYDDVWDLMKPSTKYRNVVVHRDIWSNNVMVKTDNDGNVHALLVDFQTVLYSPAMLDVSSMIYFNTTKKFRDNHLEYILEHYYKVLSEELEKEGIAVSVVYSDKSVMLNSYEESVLFGITQAALIVPIVAMGRKKRAELFCNPETAAKINTVSRSKEFIEIAEENVQYENKVTELFDEIVERYVLKSRYGK